MRVLYFLILLFLVYVVLKISLSILQISYVKTQSKKSPVVLSEDEYVNSAKILISNQKFEIVSLVFTSIVSLVWLFYGLNKLFSLIVVKNSVIENLEFVMAFLFINTILMLPFEIYSTFVKDKKHGFSKITPKLFIQDTLKSLFLMAVFGSGFVYLILMCIDFLGEYWWIWAFAISFGIILIINLIYPTIIAPIFNKLTPLDDNELKSSIEGLLESVGFKSSGVFVMDASKRDNRLNAYFGGLGSTKRVVLFDTLIKKLSVEEILAVLGHELGHFKHKDIIKMIVMSAIMLLSIFFILGNLPQSVYDSFGISGSSSIIIFFLIFSPILTFIFSPIIGAVSRLNEFAADEFGSSIKDKNSMMSALVKLGSENKAFPKSHPLYSAIYHSHPSLYERIEKLKNKNENF